jgi:hypothetical protein
MKKFSLIFAFIGMILIQSCTINDSTPQTSPVDNDTIADVFEVTRSFTSTNNYSTLFTFPRAIYSSDMVLVYHLYDVTTNGTDIWRQMPQTYYLTNNGQLDYNFDFTKYDVKIFLDANFNLNTLSTDWSQSQTFRIVVVPGAFAGKNATTIQNLDYNSVIKKYNIDETKIQKLN